MKRRDFTGKISLASLSLALGGGAILYNCNEKEELGGLESNSFLSDDSVSLNYNLVKETLNEYCLQSNEAKFYLYKDIFRQKRIIVIVDDYSLLDIKKDRYGRDIDCVLRLNVVDVIKCNFDIFKGGFNVCKSSKIGRVFHNFVSEDGLNYRFGNFKNKKYTADFPLRVLEFSTNKIVLQEGFQMPCFMTSKSLKESNFYKLFNI